MTLHTKYAPLAKNRTMMIRERRGCAQLFFIYAGTMGLLGMRGGRFLLSAGLIDRNLAMIRDPNPGGLFQGTNEDIDDLIDWHSECRDAFSHASYVHCVGDSMGGYDSLMFGYLIKADIAWAFSFDAGGAFDSGAMGLLHELLSEGNGGTEYRIYFSVDNDVDRKNAELLESCPGVVLYPITGVDKEYSHGIMSWLSETGQLSSVFPAFEPSVQPSP